MSHSQDGRNPSSPVDVEQKKAEHRCALESLDGHKLKLGQLQSFQEFHKFKGMCTTFIGQVSKLVQDSEEKAQRYTQNVKRAQDQAKLAPRSECTSEPSLLSLVEAY